MYIYEIYTHIKRFVSYIISIHMRYIYILRDIYLNIYHIMIYDTSFITSNPCLVFAPCFGIMRPALLTSKSILASARHFSANCLTESRSARSRGQTTTSALGKSPFISSLSNRGLVHVDCGAVEGSMESIKLMEVNYSNVGSRLIKLRRKIKWTSLQVRHRCVCHTPGFVHISTANDDFGSSPSQLKHRLLEHLS